MPKHRYDYAMNLKLELVKCDDGYSYEWQDQHGKIWCSGWSAGTKRDARQEAEQHLKGAMEN